MKKKLVVLTGAGMSAESGISTFRDSDGLWEKHRVEDVATPQAFLRDPELVLRFYNVRRKELLNTDPNQGHKIIADLEKHFDLTIITQNVDNLHERAGSTRVIHLHGELMQARSSRDANLIFDLDVDNHEINLGDKAADGSQLRPHIVWFGEAVPKMEEAIEHASRADIFLVVGTSLAVYPAASLLHYAPKHIPKFIIDPKSVSTSAIDVKHIQKGASQGMEEFKNIVLSL